VYATDNPADFSSTSYSAYRLIGNEMRTNSYVMQLHLGEYGDITAKSGNGNSTSYYCDYHYTDVSSTSLRAVLFGGLSLHGATAGLVYSYSVLAPSTATAYVGSRLCYFDAWKDVVYEEHEWLVGDGSAYINTKVKLHFATDSVYIKGSKNGVTTDKSRFFGNYSGGENAKSLELIYYTSVQNDTVSKPFVTDGRFGINPSSEFEFYTTPFSSTTSVSIIYNGDTTIFNVNLNEEYLEYEASNDLILLNTNDTRYCMKANVANFKVIRSSTIIRNLIPCRLIRPIPATLDANGIARDAGECGMWDKVSNKFYGNVASTGRFTVEGQRLYEEFDWLCGNGTAYFRIPVNIYQESLYVKFHPISSDADREFWAGFYNVSSNTIIEIRGMIGSSNELAIRFGLRENGEATTSVLIKRNIDFLSDFTIETQYSEDNKVNVTFNGSPGTATPIIDSRANKDVLVAFKTTWCRFAMVTTDRISLTPVRLLRPLPAYMDANGRPRAAGECGMWDKVSNKFYGNVATSGRFTVLNN
jgi:hypothetical protein